MSWGVLNAAMLLGLGGAALPVIIHLLNRRRGPVIDWGAMQFLEPGRRARRRIRLAELLLMAARMGLLALVALALARPFWAARAGGPGTGTSGIDPGGPPRDVVLVLDVSASMGRDVRGTTLLAQAVAWAQTVVGRCRPGDSVALLLAGDRVRGLIDPPAFDLKRVGSALESVKSARGSSDLPAAIALAFGILERSGNPAREVIVLSDGQRYPWRPGESARWDLLRSLHARLTVPPLLWSITFRPDEASDLPNASVGGLSISRSLLAPGLPVELTATVLNAGPGAFSGALELLIDGQNAGGSAQPIGPVPPGGRVPVNFRTSLSEPGSHLIAVRLLGRDAVPADDLAELAVQVVKAIPVLLVDGEPGVEPFSGDTDFLRAALAPSDDETPQFRVRVITQKAFDGESLLGQRVVVLANMDRLSPGQSAALADFVDSGGGILVAPGDRTEAAAWNQAGWIPAKLGASRGSTLERKAIAHPAARSFSGQLMTAFALGDAPALAEADFFAFQTLSPVDGSAVLARFDTGEPWVVERRVGRGRVVVLSAAIDAEAGTLPVNPDFVPLAHEWIAYLAGGGESLLVRPGQPLVFPLEVSPPNEVTTLAIETPGGIKARAEVIRGAGFASARFDDTTESGVYRLTLPDPPGGVVFGTVLADEREIDMTPLAQAEAGKLAEGWPMTFDTEANQGSTPLAAATSAGKHEVWRMLVIAALLGLCLEIYLTRRLVRAQMAG